MDERISIFSKVIMHCDHSMGVGKRKAFPDGNDDNGSTLGSDTSYSALEKMGGHSSEEG